jgi:hypothetical protein
MYTEGYQILRRLRKEFLTKIMSQKSKNTLKNARFPCIIFQSVPIHFRPRVLILLILPRVRYTLPDG